MDTSSCYTVYNTELQATKNMGNNKNYGTELVFQLVLESLDSDIDKESFDKTLEFLIKNQKVKIGCYASKTCRSIPKEGQIKNIHTTDKDNLKEDFSIFKNLMINEF